MSAASILADAGSEVLMRNKRRNDESMMAMIAPDSHVLGGPCMVAGLHNLRSANTPRIPIYTMFDHNEGTSEREEVSEENNIKHSEKKRRLTNDQVKSLEMSFEMDNKLEPEKKNQLAHELGLQPRQVAIWFQNRRARCKAKQLERGYNSLKQQYDAVLAEKERLVAQVLKLKDLLQMQDEECRKVENEASQVTIINNAQDEGEEEENEGSPKPENNDAISPILYSDDAVSEQKVLQKVKFSSRKDQNEVLDASRPDEQQKNIAHMLDTIGQHLVPSERLNNAAQYLYVKLEEDYSHPEELYSNGFFTHLEEQGAMLCFDWPN